MIMLASDWLAIALLLCVFAWFAGRWLALGFAGGESAAERATSPPPRRMLQQACSPRSSKT